MPYKYNPITKSLDYYEAGVGSFTLNDVSDVSTGGATQDQVLAYNSSSGTWSPATISGSGASQLSDLSDVDTTGATQDQILSYDVSSGTWTPVTITDAVGATQLSELSDVDPSGATDNQVLVYSSGSGEWTPSDVSDPTAITTATTYYVDGDSGDDTNDGLSWANAKKTLDFLRSDGVSPMPRELKADVTVNVRGSVLSVGTDYHTKIDSFYGGGTLSLVGETADEVTGLTPTAYDNTSSSQTYHKYITVSGAGWVANAYRGMFVQFTNPAADTLYPILSNTTDTIQTTALPDLAGTETFKIVSLSSIIKRATVADPSTPVTYGLYDYDFVLIENNSIKLEINRIDFETDNYTSLISSISTQIGQVDLNEFSSNSILINECKLPVWYHLSNTTIQIQNSYTNLQAYYGLSGIQYIFNTVVYSSDGFGNGAFNQVGGYSAFRNVRFSNQRTAIWASPSELGIQNVEIDSCTNIGLIIYANCQVRCDGAYYGPLVFTNNPVAIDVYKGGSIFVEDGDTHYFSGNTQDIRWNFRPDLYCTWAQYYTDKDKIEGNPLRSSGGTKYTPDAINNDMAFYVDGTSGNDTNDGSSWSVAKKTLSFLAKDATYPLPRIINSDITVYCKNTIYSTGTTNFARIEGFSGTGSITFVGETTDAQTGLTPTGYDNTKTSLTYHQYIDVSGAGWTVNAYKGGFIVFTDATSDEWFPIISNTATRLETVALPDLAGTETFKIVTLDTKFKAATTAAPGTPLTYDGYGLNGLVVHDNEILVTFDRMDIGSEFNDNYFSLQNYGGAIHDLSATISTKTVEFKKCLIANLWNISGPIVVRNSYVDSNNYGGILLSSYSHAYMICGYSTDGTGGIFSLDQAQHKVTIECTRVENSRSHLSILAGSSVRIQYDFISRGNTTAIDTSPNCIVRMTDDYYGAWVFENNTLGMNLAGCTLYYDVAGDYLNYSGNTHDIKTSDNPDEFASFADLIAGTRISNLSERTFVVYASGGSWYTQPEYLNGASGLTATTFQDAIDELNTDLGSYVTTADLASGTNAKGASLVGIETASGTPPTLQTFINGTQSSQYYDGGVITENAALDGTIDISTIKAYISKDDDIDSFDMTAIEVSGVTGVSVNSGTNLICLDYNGGSPQFTVETTDPNHTTVIGLGQVFKDEIGSLHIVQGGHNFLGLPWKTHRRFLKADSLKRTSGIVVSDGSENMTMDITAGVMYRGIKEFSVGAYDSTLTFNVVAVNQGNKTFSVAGDHTDVFTRSRDLYVDDSTGNDNGYIITTSEYTGGNTVITVEEAIPNATADGHIHPDAFIYWSYSTDGGWQRKNQQGHISDIFIDNTYYNDITKTEGSEFVELTVNRYTVSWVFKEASGETSVVYGQGDYTLAQAEAAGVPGSLPPLVNSMCVLIAKIIVQKGGTSFYEIQYPWNTVFSSTGATDHGNLAGLLDDDHTQYLLANGTRDADYIQFTTGGSGPTHSEGVVFYDDESKTLALQTKESDVTLNLGQEHFVLVTNKTDDQINNGQVVYISGVQGNRPTIALADASNADIANKTIGVATHDIPKNNDGFITTAGIVRDINTAGLTIGNEIFLTSTPGAFDDEQEVSPSSSVKIGYVLVADGSEGIILVSITNHGVLNRLYDINIDTPLNGQIIKYNASNSRWENSQSSIETEDTDVDTGDTVMDSFSASSFDACFWEYVLSNTDSGTSKRAGTVTATWDASGGTTVYFDSSTSDIGDTSAVTFSVDYELSGGQIQLIATTTTDNWSIKVRRRTL